MLGETVIARPKTWACLTSFTTLLVGAATIVLADFGGPVWVFVVFGVWLWTAGLPTTLAVLLLASVWGNIPWIATGSLGAFAVCTVILSLIFQILTYRWSVRFLQSPASVVATAIHRPKENATGIAGGAFLVLAIVVAFGTPSAEGAEIQRTPTVDRTPHEYQRKQSYRPSYLLREAPAADQDHTFPFGPSFPGWPELRLSKKSTQGIEGSAPAVSGTTPPRPVFLKQDAAVLLRLVSGKVTSRHKPGRQVTFQVEEDVPTGDGTCIARGTLVVGVVGPWTRAASGPSIAARLEIHFNDVPMATRMPAPLQTIRVIRRTRRTLGKSMSWVQEQYQYIDSLGAALGLGTAALGQLTGESFVRAMRKTFKTDEVKFHKGDVIRVNVWASWLLPCDAGLTLEQHQTERAEAAPEDGDGPANRTPGRQI
jgi:hypothetical protein